MCDGEGRGGSDRGSIAPTGGHEIWQFISCPRNHATRSSNAKTFLHRRSTAIGPTCGSMPLREGARRFPHRIGGLIGDALLINAPLIGPTYSVQTSAADAASFAWLELPRWRGLLSARSTRNVEGALDKSALARLARVAAESYDAMARSLRGAKAEQRAQAQHCQTVINSLSQGVSFFDREGLLILCNHRFAEIYRLTLDQVAPGSTLREIRSAAPPRGRVRRRPTTIFRCASRTIPVRKREG